MTNEGIIGSVGVAVVPNAEDFWRRFRAQTSAGAGEAGRRAGEDWSRGFRAGAGEPTVRVRVDSNNAQQQTAGLLAGLLALAPAVVPLAGAAVLAGAALANMGAAGVLAVKGIQADIKAANADGLKFSAGLGVLKTDLQGLEHTAAHGVMASFQDAVAKLHATMPSLNTDMAQTSHTLGSIADHVLTGVIGGLHNFAPALQSVAQLVDGLAARFDTWATGPGGAKFAQTLAEDFQHVEPLLQNLVGTIGHLIAASNGTGLAIVDELNVLAKVLNEIPIPVLSALTAGLVGLRIASTITGLMNKLALSIRTVATAEGEAAAAGAFRTGLATTVGILGKVVAGWLAVSIAAGAAANATQGWQSNTNVVKVFFGTLSTAVNDLGHFNFKGFWSDLFGAGAHDAAKTRGYVIQLNDSLNDMWNNLSGKQTPTLFKDGFFVLPGHGSLAAGLKDISGAQQGVTVLQQIQNSYTHTVNETTAALARQRAVLATIASGASVSQLQTAYTGAASSLEKNITATEKFLSLGGEEVNTYKGVSVTAGMYQVALAKTGGNLEAATGFIEAQIDALGRQKGALAAEQAGQLRLGTYLSDVGLKYKLTSDQVGLYTQVLGINAGTIAGSNAGMKNAEQLLGRFVRQLQNGDTAITGWVSAVAAWDKSAQTAADRGQLLASAMQAFNGTAISYGNTMVQAATANQQLVTDLKNVHSGVINLKTGFIDYHNAAAGPVLSDLAQLQQTAMQAAAATYQLEVNHLGAKKAAKDAADVYRNDTTVALREQLVQLGYTLPLADKLANRYFHWPKDAKTQIAALGADSTNNLLKDIRDVLAYISGRRWNFTVDADVSAAITKLNILHQKILGSGGFVVTGSGAHGFASGTGSAGLPDGLSWVGDPGPHSELVRKQGAKVDVYSHAQSMALAGQLGLTVPKFAGGTGGETGGFGGVDFSGKANKHGIVKGGSSSSNASSLNSAFSSYLQSVLGSFVNPITAAFQSLVSSIQQSGGKLSSAFVDYLRGENNQLRATAAERDRIANQLAAAQQRLSGLQQSRSSEIGSVRGATTGTFNIATAGQNQFGEPVTLFDIRSELAKDLANAKRFERVLRRLGHEGLNKFLLAQLAEAGPGALPEAEALLSATPKQLASINSQFHQLNSVGQSLGTYIGNDLYNAGIKSAEGLIRGLKSKENALTQTMRHLADVMVGQLKADLQIHSPSKVMAALGGHTGAGFALGLESTAGRVQAAASLVAGKSIPNRPAYNWSGLTANSPAAPNMHFEPHYHNSVPETGTRSEARSLRAFAAVLGR